MLILLYYDFTAQVRKRDDFFGDLKNGKNGELASLAKELISRHIIAIYSGNLSSEEEDVANLTSYLQTISVYDRARIESIFLDYSRLFRYSKRLLSFLKGQKICREDSNLNFRDLLEEVKTARFDFLDQLRVTTESRIRESSLMSNPSTDWLEPISLAVIALFLVEHEEDMFISDVACRRAASVGRTVRILYEHSWVNDDEQHKSPENRTLLSTIIVRVISGNNSRSTEYFSEFQRGLTAGYLFRRISDIPLTRMRHIDDQVTKAVSQMEFETQLKSHLQALGTVLESELKTGIIMESLRMQLVAAYAITIPTEANVIRGVIDTILPDICANLAADDPIYRDIFIKAEATESSIGRYTRLGVVPYNMSFNDFADRLNTAYRIAVNRYKDSGKMEHDIEKYVANVIRIFPTSAYFRQLEPLDSSAKKGANDFLADLIRPLMLKKFGEVRSVQILASLKTSEEDRLAMRQVLANLYDTSSGLYMIAQKQLDGVIVSPTLKEYVKVGKFDIDLTLAFERQKLSEIASIVFSTSKLGADQEAAIKRKLTLAMSKVSEALRARPEQNEIDNIALAIFQALYDIGMILNVIAA